MSRKSLVFIAGLFSLLLIGCESKPVGTAAEAPGIPVIAASPTVKDITVYVDAIGTLKPAILMEIRPQVSGTLAEVLVSEGQSVQRGTPLFSVEPQLYVIKVKEAEAQLAIDKACLLAVTKKLARFKDLAQKDLMAQTEWDDLESQADIAQANVDLAEARLSTAKMDLEDCMMSSPVEGRVGKIDVHPGLQVSASQTEPLVTISKIDPLIVEFTVTEKEFSTIPAGEVKLEMQPFCSSGTCKAGKITFLDNHFDAKTGLLLVRGVVANPEYALRPGQSIRVNVPISVSSGAKLIPQKAIRYNQQGPYVYVVQADKTVALRQIVLGKEHETDQIVLEGLSPEEVIIIEGHLRLYPGIKVDIKS